MSYVEGFEFLGQEKTKNQQKKEIRKIVRNKNEI